MSGTTPTQAFVYSTPSDRPDLIATVWAQLAGQLDLKGLGYDTDAARVAANTFVKVSVTNSNSITGNPVFTTVEVNRGTPTDTSVYSGIILNSGLYVVGGSVVYTPANNSLEIDANIIYSPVDAAHQPSVAWPFVSSKDNFGTTVGSGGGMNFPNQTLSVLDVTMLTAQSKVTIGFDSGSWNYPYMDLWAFQIGDI